MSGVSSIEYLILPGKPPANFEYLDLYNEAYRFWRSFWGNVLDEVGGDRRTLRADEFFRQDLFSVLVAQGEIVGMHTYTVFDLNQVPTYDHSYINKYVHEHSQAKLRDMHVSRFMTIEYFSLKPGWRGPDVGVSMGRVLGLLSMRVGESLGLDGVLGAARVDVGAAHIADDIGMVTIQRGIEVFGKPTNIVLWKAGTKSLAARAVNDLVDEFWEKRVDTTGETLSKTISKNAA